MPCEGSVAVFDDQHGRRGDAYAGQERSDDMEESPDCDGADLHGCHPDIVHRAYCRAEASAPPKRAERSLTSWKPGPLAGWGHAPKAP